MPHGMSHALPPTIDCRRARPRPKDLTLMGGASLTLDRPRGHDVFPRSQDPHDPGLQLQFGIGRVLVLATQDLSQSFIHVLPAPIPPPRGAGLRLRVQNGCELCPSLTPVHPGRSTGWKMAPVPQVRLLVSSSAPWQLHPSCRWRRPSCRMASLPPRWLWP